MGFPTSSPSGKPEAPHLLLFVGRCKAGTGGASPNIQYRSTFIEHLSCAQTDGFVSFVMLIERVGRSIQNAHHYGLLQRKQFATYVDAV